MIMAIFQITILFYVLIIIMVKNKSKKKYYKIYLIE